MQQPPLNPKFVPKIDPWSSRWSEEFACWNWTFVHSAHHAFQSKCVPVDYMCCQMINFCFCAFSFRMHPIYPALCAFPHHTSSPKSLPNWCPFWTLSQNPNLQSSLWSTWKPCTNFKNEKLNDTSPTSNQHFINIREIFILSCQLFRSMMVLTNMAVFFCVHSVHFGEWVKYPTSANHAIPGRKESPLVLSNLCNKVPIFPTPNNLDFCLKSLKKFEWDKFLLFVNIGLNKFKNTWKI